MRFLYLALFAVALTACLSSAQADQPPVMHNPAAIGNAAQATAHAAWSIATQQAGATMAAHNATAQAYADAQLREAQRVAMATQQAGSDAATSTANVRATWDAATSTAGAMALQSTALAGTQAALISQSTSQAVNLAAERQQFAATQAAMLSQNTWRSAATATVTALDERARADRYQTNLIYGGGGGCMTLALFVAFMGITALVRTISHRHYMAELSLQAAIGHTPALLAAPATVTDNAGQRIAVNNWPQRETPKRKALAWIARSIARNGADATELVGWPGAESMPVRDALEAAGLVRVEARGGTYVEQGDLAGLLRDVEAMTDDLA